jgi:hypothetical protein
MDDFDDVDRIDNSALDRNGNRWFFVGAPLGNPDGETIVVNGEIRQNNPSSEHVAHPTIITKVVHTIKTEDSVNVWKITKVDDLSLGEAVMLHQILLLNTGKINPFHILESSRLFYFPNVTREWWSKLDDRWRTEHTFHHAGTNFRI